MSRQQKRALFRLLQIVVCLGVILSTLKLSIIIIGDEDKPLPAADELRKLLVSHTLHSINDIDDGKIKMIGKQNRFLPKKYNVNYSYNLMFFEYSVEWKWLDFVLKI